MSPRFEELDWSATPMSDLSLRRRLDPTAGVEMFEVKLGDEFLMSSLFTVAGSPWQPGHSAFSTKSPSTSSSEAWASATGHRCSPRPARPLTRRCRLARTGERLARKQTGPGLDTLHEADPSGQRGLLRPRRPLFAPADPVSRTSYATGELAQCDLWFPPVDIPVGFGQVARPPVLTMLSGYSRQPGAVMIPTRQADDLIAGHWSVLTGWGSVPRALVWDGEAALSSRKGGKAKLTDAFEAFRGMLGIKVIICKPGDPEARGLVERFNGYLETSFLPGRCFASPADFNDQVSSWLSTKAIWRSHRTLGCRPVDRPDGRGP